MDNFYNGVELAEKLLEREKYCTGTLWFKQKLNLQVGKVKLRRGKVVEKKWRDKKDMLAIYKI